MGSSVTRRGGAHRSSISFDGQSLQPGAEEFRKAVASLASMYKRHIGVEDELVFPLAARLLSDGDKSAIADKMAGRRKVRLVTDLSRRPQVEPEPAINRGRVANHHLARTLLLQNSDNQNLTSLK